VLFCITLPYFVQIGAPTAEIWRHIHFSTCRTPAMLYLLWSYGGPPTKCLSRSELGHQIACLVGLIVPEILRLINFGVLAWNCLFTPLFVEFLGHIFPIWRHSLSWPRKGPSLGGNTSFELFSVRICASVRPGRRMEKKGQDNKKSQKCYISPIWGKPPLDRFDPKVEWWVMSTT